GDAVAARLGDRTKVLLRAHDHQMDVEDTASLVDDRRDRLPHDRPDRDRLDELPVADVELEDPRAGVHERLELLAEAREVGRVDRRLDLDAPHPVTPAHDQERKPRTHASWAIRLPASGCTSTSSRRSPSSRERQTVTFRPSTSPRAPMCGERARIRSCSSFADRDQSSSRSPGPIFSAYVGSPCCGSNESLASAPAMRSGARRATSPYPSPPVVSPPIQRSSRAPTGPASSSSTRR